MERKVFLGKEEKVIVLNSGHVMCEVRVRFPERQCKHQGTWKQNARERSKVGRHRFQSNINI